MYKRMIIGATALALLAGVAFAAQDAPPPPPSQDNGQVADNGPPSPPPPGDGQDEGWGGGWKKWMGHRGHGRGMRGPDGRGGPGGPGGMGMMMHMKGFRMHLGRGVNVDVACGEEAMKDCIASAQPLIDAAKTAAAAQPAEAPKAP
ncbi:MAG: hypothetical protein ABIN69_12335 [Aestuariivirga sp.]